MVAVEALPNSKESRSFQLSALPKACRVSSAKKLFFNLPHKPPQATGRKSEKQSGHPHRDGFELTE